MLAMTKQSVANMAGDQSCRKAAMVIKTMNVVLAILLRCLMSVARWFHSITATVVTIVNTQPVQRDQCVMSPKSQNIEPMTQATGNVNCELTTA